MSRAVQLFAATLLLCLIRGSRQLAITDFEVPVAVELGSQAELHCGYELDGQAEDDVIVKWWWTPANDTSDKKQLYQRIGTQPGGLLHRENRKIIANDSLVLIAPTPLDSGTYECEVSIMSEKAEEERKREKLSVFTPGTGPNLTMTEVPDGPDEDSEDDVLIDCKAEEVAPVPYLLLKVNYAEHNWTERVVGPDERGRYAVHAHAALAADAVRGAEVACELLYRDEDLQHPQYIHQILYTSGSEPTTEAQEPALEPDVAPPSAQHPSGDSSRCRAWPALVAASLAAYLRALSLPM